MAKIRVAQIKDLSLENGVITIGTGNTITPLTTVAPLTETGANKFVSGFTVNGNTIVPTFTAVDLSAYSTTEQMNSAISLATTDMATKTWVGEQLANYSTTEQMNSAISLATTDMATKTWVNTTLADYVLKSSINTGTLAPTSTTTIPSEKTVADYVAAQLATLDTTAYTSGNGIDITNHVVSAVVKTGDQVLSVDANGLKTTIGITYDETNKEIKLVGIDGAQIGDAIDATAFIKDGMLKSVTLDGTDLVLTWNTDGDPDESGVGGDVVRVPLGSLVDVYTADETYIKLGTDNKFSHVEVLDAETIVGNKTSDLVFSYPKLTVDKAGHVTQVTAQDITIPTATTIASETGAGLATEGAVKTYVDSQFSAQATKHIHQESTTPTINLTSTPVNTANDNFDVYQNGIRLNESEFSVSGTTMTIKPEVPHVEGDKYLVCYVAKA